MSALDGGDDGSTDQELALDLGRDLGRFWESGLATDRRRAVSALAAMVGVDPGTIEISKAKDGTKQLRNRLGQQGVQRATQLVVFLDDDPVRGEASSAFVADAVLGRNDSRPPRAPVGFAYPHADGRWSITHLVQSTPTDVSRVVARAFPHLVTVQPQDSVEVMLPDDATCWLLRNKSGSGYLDIDGVRYHFPDSIPNGQQVQAGDLVVLARYKSADTPDAGRVLGIGRVGRRTDVADGVFAYYDRYLPLGASIDLEEFGNPATNMNAIWRFETEEFGRLMQRIGLADIDDAPVPITALGPADVLAAVESSGLVLPESLVTTCLAALWAGKHLMLTGPPGTGKTSLAEAIASAAAGVGLCEDFHLTTGTADWTSVETVGAYRITKEQELRFHAGHVVRSIEANSWLVVDELNRADIDKAIGQLFTVLSGQAVVLPFDEEVGTDEILPISIVPAGRDVPAETSPRLVSENWRLIATMNDRDRDLLFDISEALMRRFAIIEVGIPDETGWAKILEQRGQTGRASIDAALLRLVTSQDLTARPVGPAVILDCAAHIRQAIELARETAVEPSDEQLLQAAIDMFLRPQLQTAMSSGPDLRAAAYLGSPAESPDELGKG